MAIPNTNLLQLELAFQSKTVRSYNRRYTVYVLCVCVSVCVCVLCVCVCVTVTVVTDVQALRAAKAARPLCHWGYWGGNGLCSWRKLCTNQTVRPSWSRPYQAMPRNRGQ